MFDTIHFHELAIFVTNQEVAHINVSFTFNGFVTHRYLNERLNGLGGLTTVLTSATAAGTVAKTAPAGNFILSVGVITWVRFNNANTSLNPTLNVGGSGAFPILFNGESLGNANQARHIAANITYGFIFTGSGWEMIKPASNLINNGIATGSSTTAVGTAAKTVAIAGFARRTGSIVFVHFTNGNSHASPTLNVNSTGAAPIQFSGGALPTASIRPNTRYCFVFDGTNWQIINPTQTDSGLTPIVTSTSFSTAAVKEAPAPYDGFTLTPGTKVLIRFTVSVERKINITKKACPFGLFYHTPKPHPISTENVPFAARLCICKILKHPKIIQHWRIGCYASQRKKQNNRQFHVF